MHHHLGHCPGAGSDRGSALPQGRGRTQQQSSQEAGCLSALQPRPQPEPASASVAEHLDLQPLLLLLRLLLLLPLLLLPILECLHADMPSNGALKFMLLEQSSSRSRGGARPGKA